MQIEPRTGWLLYRAAYYLGIAWMLAFPITLVVTKAVTAASPLEMKLLILALSIGPCAALWLCRRIVTGRWL